MKPVTLPPTSAMFEKPSLVYCCLNKCFLHIGQPACLKTKARIVFKFGKVQICTNSSYFSTESKSFYLRIGLQTAHIEPTDAGRIIIAHEYTARAKSRAKRIRGIKIFGTAEI